MTQSADLLRMLEPTVRPTGTPAPAATGRPAFDQVDFARVLQQAQQTGTNPVAQQQATQAIASGESFLEEAAKSILGLDRMPVPGQNSTEETEAVESASSSNESIWMQQLGQVNRIENESLRQTLGLKT